MGGSRDVVQFLKARGLGSCITNYYLKLSSLKNTNIKHCIKPPLKTGVGGRGNNLTIILVNHHIELGDFFYKESKLNIKLIIFWWGGGRGEVSGDGG